MTDLRVEEIRKAFLKAMTQSLKDYDTYGARSTNKLLAPHRWIGETVLAQLGEEFCVESLGVGTGKEAKVPGKYYDKTVDVAVRKRDGPTVAVASFKFVTSNYKQNSVNYFEGLLGETANLRRMGVGFAHLLVLRKNMPYLNRAEGISEREEKITEHNMAKYIKLFRDEDFPHKPDVLGIAVIDFSNDARFCEEDDSFDFSTETISALRNDLSVERFIEKFVQLCQFLS